MFAARNLRCYLLPAYRKQRSSLAALLGMGVAVERLRASTPRERMALCFSLRLRRLSRAWLYMQLGAWRINAQREAQAAGAAAKIKRESGR